MSRSSLPRLPPMTGTFFEILPRDIMNELHNFRRECGYQIWTTKVQGLLRLNILSNFRQIFYVTFDTNLSSAYSGNVRAYLKFYDTPAETFNHYFDINKFIDALALIQINKTAIYIANNSNFLRAHNGYVEIVNVVTGEYNPFSKKYEYYERVNKVLSPCRALIDDLLEIDKLRTKDLPRNW